MHRWIPGIISGGADNDPAGISTYAISGARFGYQQLWLLLLSTPMLIAIQAMCARLGDVKHKGLMAIIKEHYAPIFVLMAAVILILTNTATMGADLAGIASAFGLITNTPFSWWVVPVSLVLWYIVLFRSHRVIEKYLFFLSFIFLAYVVSGFMAQPNWLEIVQSIFWPRFPASLSYFVAALGLLGTTITPFLFFWQARQGTEEHRSLRQLHLEAKHEDEDIAPGFIYSNFISLFIMISTATVLYRHGTSSIITAADASQALEPLAGGLAKYLFAVGIIGSGFLAVPVLASSTAYVIAEVFAWRESLSDKINQAKGFYTALTASMFVGMGIALSGINPLQALLYSQVLNGILAPFLIILILLMCNNKKIMGTFTNTRFDNFFGWLTVMVMILASLGLFWELVTKTA